MANGISSGPNLSCVIVPCGTAIDKALVFKDQPCVPTSPSACNIKFYSDGCGNLKKLDPNGKVSDVGGGIGGTDVIKVYRACADGTSA